MKNFHLNSNVIRIQLPVSRKADLLNALVDMFEGEKGVLDLDAVRKAVFAREKQVSTGVGSGLGLPHARTHGVTRTMASFATTASPIPYGSLDGVDVQIALMLIGPVDAASEHLKVLSHVSRLMSQSSVREALLRAKTSAEVLEILN